MVFANARLYIDNTNLGTIASSSDCRIKQNISAITTECIDRIKLLRLSIGPNYGELFTPDGVFVKDLSRMKLQVLFQAVLKAQKMTLTAFSHCA